MGRALLVEETRNAGSRSYPLTGQRVTIGRSPSCDITVNHTSVSRDHAAVLVRDGRYTLVDQNSRNGTRVNGVAVARHSLSDGDRIAVGSRKLTFCIIAEVGDGALVEPGAAAPATGNDELTVDVASHTSSTNLSFGYDVRAVNAWQIVRAFALVAEQSEQRILRSLMENMVGIRGVHRVALCLAAGGAEKKKLKWHRAGASRSRSGVCFPDARIEEVAREGTCIPQELARGVPADWDAQRTDYVCVAIQTAGSSVGAIYVEGEDGLSRETLEATLGAAEAIGIGLTIRSVGKAAVPSARPTGASVGIVGCSRPLQRCVGIALKAATADSTVLIRGESGTGKELFARLVFSESRRRDRAFLPVHCSAIEENLLGSALFGHEKGAYTGAYGAKRGIFEETDGGPIFLDEIGELSLAMQVRLLRVLQEGEFMRLGGNRTIKVDVRVIAATNRDLEAAVKGGQFREDLYYRLKVIELTLPPLRDRSDDIPELANYFFNSLSQDLATHVRSISPDAMALLEQYGWPGNVRELRNVIERSLVLAEGESLEVDDLPIELMSAVRGDDDTEQPDSLPEGAELEELERRHIRQVLRECGGNKKLAAERLGISRSTLYEKLRRSDAT